MSWREGVSEGGRRERDGEMDTWSGAERARRAGVGRRWRGCWMVIIRFCPVVFIIGSVLSFFFYTTWMMGDNICTTSGGRFRTIRVEYLGSTLGNPLVAWRSNLISAKIKFNP